MSNGARAMRHVMGKTTALAFAALTFCATSPAGAQAHGNGYLFHKPDARVTVRGGYALAVAGSDLFSQVTQDLTLNKSDFSGLTVGIDVSLPVSDRLELGVDAGLMRSNRGSEFRHFVDNNDLPIQQTTTFERVPLMVNARYYLSAPGRSIGKLAWIPSHIAPWVGVGAGTMWYRFMQQGDFINFSNNKVFRSDLKTEGWTPAFQAIAGTDVTLNPMFALTADARYVWARGTVGGDYSGFDKLDLSGVSATVGLTIRL